MQRQGRRHDVANCRNERITLINHLVTVCTPRCDWNDVFHADAFERIVSSGAPIRGARSTDDLDAAGVWSEFMLFNGTHWLDERCAAAVALCGVLRRAAEVAGEVVGSDGVATPPQGQVTIFRF